MMFIISLVLSSILLLLANRLAYRSQRPILNIVLTGLAFAFGPLCLMFQSLAVMLQALLLVVVIVVLTIVGHAPRYFAPLSCAATLVAYLVIGCMTLSQMQRLRQEFAFVSMEERLPRAKATRVVLGAESLHQLDSLEAAVEQRTQNTWGYKRRVEGFRQLHEDAVTVFINAPGFGFARMPFVSAWTVTGRAYRPELRQPGVPDPLLLSPGELLVLPAPPAKETPDLQGLLQASLLDFGDPVSYGYVRDRRHVAGYLGHHFTQVPKVDDWKVRSVELVGLAMHEDPVVYVSSHLPRTNEPGEPTTRPPDAFEATGLDALRGGEDIFARDTKGGRRLLGALRAVKQCQECHDCKRGELLGAFSYFLQRETPDEPGIPEWLRKTVPR